MSRADDAKTETLLFRNNTHELSAEAAAFEEAHILSRASRSRRSVFVELFMRSTRDCFTARNSSSICSMAEATVEGEHARRVTSGQGDLCTRGHCALRNRTSLVIAFGPPRCCTP